MAEEPSKEPSSRIEVGWEGGGRRGRREEKVRRPSSTKRLRSTGSGKEVDEDEMRAYWEVRMPRFERVFR